MDGDENITSRFTIGRDGPFALKACNRVGRPKIMDNFISFLDNKLAFILSNLLSNRGHLIP